MDDGGGPIVFSIALLLALGWWAIPYITVGLAIAYAFYRLGGYRSRRFTILLCTIVVAIVWPIFVLGFAAQLWQERREFWRTRLELQREWRASRPPGRQPNST